MALPGYGGETQPYVVYGGKSGQWQKVDEKVKTPVTLGEIIIDLENLRTGWGKFADGQAPEWVMNKDKTVFGPIPSEAVDKDGKKMWKKGVKVTFFSPATFGGDGLRAFDTTAFGAYSGISQALDLYEAAAAANPGKVPVFAYKGFTNHGSGQKATTIPQFELLRWVDRPAGLVAGGAPQTVHAANQAAPVQKAAVGEF